MPIDPNDKGKALPVRSPTCTGDSNERQMDARVVDNLSCATVLRLNPDGSQTMLRTRGGYLDYTTTLGTPVEEAPLCRWSYDYFPIKLDGETYVSDTTTSLGHTIYQSSVPYGLKGRRKGLTYNADGTMSLKLQVSHEDLPTDGSKMTGPGFWYSKGDTVTWTYTTLVPSDNPLQHGMELAIAFCVRYKKEEIILRPTETFNIVTSDHIFAACVVRDSVGTVYVRAAYLKVDGNVEEGITVIDYALDGSSVSTLRLNPDGDYPQWIDGKRFTRIKPRLGAFSPDGTKLAYIGSDYVFDATGGEMCIVAEISRPLAGETPSVAQYVATLPVGWEAATPPADVYTPSTTSASSSARDNAFIITDIATGAVVSQSDPPHLPTGPTVTFYSAIYTELTSITYTARSLFVIDRVGFSKKNELCVVATKTLVIGSHHLYARTENSSTTVEDTVSATDTTIGGGTQNLHTEVYANYTTTSINGSGPGSFVEDSWSYDITTYFIRGGAIVWSKETPLSMSGRVDFWAQSTIVDTNVGADEDYFEVYSSGVLPRGYPTEVKVGIECHGVDFYDSTVLTRYFGPAYSSYVHGYSARWEPSAHKYEEAYLVSSSGTEEATEVPIPVEFSQTFQVISVDAGTVYAPYTTVRKEFIGPAAWCPARKEAVYLYDRINEETWGLFFSGNKWKTIRAADGEPIPPTAPGVYYEIKVGLIPFA